MRLKTESGALLEVPIWEDHKRGKNWAAVIALSPTAPGGLERKFLPRAHGDYYYVITDLRVGDPVEFGADYYTGGGNREPHRWYGVVTEITPEYVEIAQCKSGREAVQEAKRFRESKEKSQERNDG